MAFRGWLITLLLCLSVMAVLRAAATYPRGATSTSNNVKTPAVADDAASNAVQRPRHPVSIRPAPEPKRIATASRDIHGEPVTLDCKACHAVRTANRQSNNTKALDEFHQGLKFQRGKLTCVACHDDRDGYSSLHRADGATITFADSMQLCAQCHGEQFRDYEHGSHGGMTGYWDLTRGGRTRNHCQDCHDPHAPAIRQVLPVAGPRDRFPPASSREKHE